MSTLAPLRFSVCLDMIFTDRPFEQRLEHIADLGFRAYEFWTRRGKDMNITIALQTALRLHCVAIFGSEASPNDPDQRALFREEVTRSAALAVDLACDNLIVHGGISRADLDYASQRACLIDALHEAAETAADAGLNLLLEPRNPLDHPRSFLWSSDEGFAIIRELGKPHVKLLFDCYHQQISEGNLTRRILANLDLIGHIHVADVPGRHEPGTGEINYEHIFGILREHAYSGYVGLEYTPRIDSAASLRAVRMLSQ
ncbi:hydroxypyruvate isomerase family protein [Chloroflexus sp. MS-G]|uniref:hydroxypyruvate isomerase family protein n=1 Tax=Chloroflexus sp. MS-G TaxID=1521187 RepID=UPI0004DF12E3|nr:TIM barrel protein [Chloroflexus sp. MS-G]